MPKLFEWVWWKVFQGFLRAGQVGEFEGIRLADLRKRGDAFLPTLLASIQLIRSHDARRFARMKEHIVWISNAVPVNDANAEHHPKEQWCVVNYFDAAPETDPRHWAAAWACVLVHESTHGLLAKKGFSYTGDRRSQIERICVAEQNRFARRLQAIDPTVYGNLIEDYDATQWQPLWKKRRLERFRSVWRRQLQD
jgi:hypothetical protein